MSIKTEILIGGAIMAKDVAGLREAIIFTRIAFEQGGTWFQPQSADDLTGNLTESKLLRLRGHTVSGEFHELESYLQCHNIHYTTIIDRWHYEFRGGNVHHISVNAHGTAIVEARKMRAIDDLLGFVIRDIRADKPVTAISKLLAGQKSMRQAIPPAVPSLEPLTIV